MRQCFGFQYAFSFLAASFPASSTPSQNMTSAAAMTVATIVALTAAENGRNGAIGTATQTTNEAMMRSMPMRYRTGFSCFASPPPYGVVVENEDWDSALPLYHIHLPFTKRRA